MFSYEKFNRFSGVRAFSQSFMIVCATLALFLGTTHANAAVLFFDSFEGGTGSPVAYPDLADGNGGNMTGINGWVNAGTANALDFDTFNIQMANTTGGPPVDNNQGDLPNGGQVMYTPAGASVRNTLTALTAVGTTYTLSARVGDSSPALGATPSAISVLLFVNGSQVASAAGTPTDNTFSSGGYVFDTLTTTPYAATANGQSIEIRIEAAGGGFSWVDAVQLDAVEAAVPEPSTFVLAALGLAGLGLVAWRRRK
ncbi:MAG: PEP-CTERM sorting domain-containing protein [Planctomycetes bacterium]|nr:PEP-CTERM sorting domain-containing protein [Planctomycetota bacterium]